MLVDEKGVFLRELHVKMQKEDKQNEMEIDQLSFISELYNILKINEISR